MLASGASFLLNIEYHACVHMALRYNRVRQNPMVVHLLFAMLQVLYSAFRTTAISKIQRLKFQFLRAKADGFTKF